MYMYVHVYIQFQFKHVYLPMYLRTLYKYMLYLHSYIQYMNVATHTLRRPSCCDTQLATSIRCYFNPLSRIHRRSRTVSGTAPPRSSDLGWLQIVRNATIDPPRWTLFVGFFRPSTCRP